MRFHVGAANEHAPPLQRLTRSTQDYFSINDLRGRIKEVPLPEAVVQLLVKLADDVIAESEPTRLYSAIVEIAVESLKAARVNVVIQNADGTLTAVAKHPASVKWEVPPPLYASIIERRGVVLMRDFDAPDHVRVESGAAMALPLFSARGVVGCVFLEAQTGESFDELSGASCAVFGALLGPCIEQTLRHEAMHIELQALSEKLRKHGSGKDDSTEE